MAKFIALELGFYNGRRIRKGETFDADPKFKAKWVTPAVEVVEKKTIPAGKGTLTVPTKDGDKELA